MYEYVTFDSKKVQDVERICNTKAQDGWEFVDMAASKDRYVLVFRRIKEDSDGDS